MMIDSAIGRRFKIRDYTISYSFLTVRMFVFKMLDYSVSWGIISLILDMAKDLGESPYYQWNIILIFWIILKSYYLYNSFTSIFEISRDYTEKR